MEASIIKKSLIIYTSHKKGITGKNALHLIAKFRIYMDSFYERKNTFIKNLASQLIEHNKNLVHEENHEGKTPLHLAIQKGNFEFFKFLLPFTDLYKKDIHEPTLLSFALKVYDQPEVDSGSETKRNINQIIYYLYERYSSYVSSMKNDFERAVKLKILEAFRLKMTSTFLRKPCYLCFVLEEYCKPNLGSKNDKSMQQIITKLLVKGKGYFSNPKNIYYVLKRIDSLCNNSLPESKKQFLDKVREMISNKYPDCIIFSSSNDRLI